MVDDEGDRVCRIRLDWANNEIQPEIEDCHRSLRDASLRAIEQWQIEPTAAPRNHLNLAEIWFVFPQRNGEEVVTLVRQTTGADLTLPAGVDAAPFAVLAWTFVDFPADMRQQGVKQTCDIDLQANAEGVAEDVQVSGCDAAYATAIRDAAFHWRFRPGLVHDLPIETSFRFQATFDPHAEGQPASWSPNDKARALWATRQFESLSRAERLWFIEAALGPTGSLGNLQAAPPPDRVGKVRIRFPRIPDQGDRPPATFVQYDVEAQPPPVPDTDPLFVVERPGRSSIKVYDVVLVEPAAELTGEASCAMVLQVDGQGHVTAWVKSCDEAMRASALDAARDWIARHDGDVRAREQFGFMFELNPRADVPVQVVVDDDEIVTPVEDRPEFLRGRSPAKPIRRVPPKLSRKILDAGLPQGACRLAVAVSKRGRPEAVDVRSCPDGVELAARKAVSRWRWRPAHQDGVAVATRTEVVIRFAPER